MNRPKKLRNFKRETIHVRIEKALIERSKIEEHIANYHVRVMVGNNKTGKSCWTVSLVPIVDCANCDKCKGTCYDICNDMWRDKVVESRAVNSAIHRLDPERYFREIGMQIEINGITELRYNIGGDFTADDFIKANDLAKQFPGTDFLAFTKNYGDCNFVLKKLGGKFEPNFHVIYSAWKGMEISNPYDMPTSHILYADGSTTAPEFGAYYCGGNCSVCHFHKVNGNKMESGCWGLEKGEAVVFPYH